MRLFLNAVAAIGLLPTLVGGQAPGKLYLLTATFNSPWPSRLYRATPQKKLDSVLDGASSVSILSPAITPTKLIVIDKDSPAHLRTQVFSSDGRFLLQSLVRLANEDHRYFQLLPLITTPGEIITRQISLSADGLGVENCLPEKYRSVYVDGNPGGPGIPTYMFGSVRADGLYLKVGNAYVRVGDRQPQLVQDAVDRFAVIGATPEFLIVAAVNWDPKHLEKSPKETIYFVRDKVQGSWTTIKVAGNNPKERLFGHWLVTSEMSVSPDNRSRSNPGHEEERDQKTADLPNVRQEFETYIGYNRYISGRLTLTNLQNQHQITFDTKAEDSEVLAINGQSIIYRVNDSIYKAPLSDKALGPATLVAQDDDVPQVHWVFWGK